MVDVSKVQVARHAIDCGGRLLDLSTPQVMGVLNITPDSFSDGGALHVNGRPNRERVLSRVSRMVDDGAAIIDVGGESTRPGSTLVTLQEEMDRVLPVVEMIAGHFDVIVSVDTSSPELMTASAELGAGLLNDVRALTRPGAISAASSSGLPVCLMHMQGSPDIMQDAPGYEDVVEDVGCFLSARADACIDGGINPQRIVLDPGFGFGKTITHNLQLLKSLSLLCHRGYPVLVGLSRKSMIGELLGCEVDQRMVGSVVLALMAVQKGASIVRVHDVAETVDAMALFAAVEGCTAG